jgi:hypothetical protein
VSCHDALVIVDRQRHIYTNINLTIGHDHDSADCSRRS